MDTAQLVRARHAQLWQGEDLNPEALRQMLDASIARLTGIQDANAAWKSLFKPTERIAIKVNSISNGVTHVAPVLVVTQCLQDAGVPAEQITIYDRFSQELTQAGYPVNKSGTGVQCHGTDGKYPFTWHFSYYPVSLSQILMDADALINIPILKAFSEGGMSLALKNHLGSVDSPVLFHESNFTPGVTALNALEQIQNKTRLVIGDVLSQETHRDAASYAVVGGPQALLVGTDPIAIDAIGLQMATEAMESQGFSTGAVRSRASEWLKEGANIGLGVCDPAKIQVAELAL